MFKNKTTLLFILAPLFGVLLAGARVAYLLYGWTYAGPAVEFTVAPGEGFSSINYRLYRDDVIPSDRLFHRYAQYQGLLTKFRVGTYKIPSGATLPVVLNTLVYGRPINKSVTIPEGKNMYEVARILETAEICPAADFIMFARDVDMLKELGVEGPSVEGYLYPETYSFSKGTPCRIVIKQMVAEFKKRFKMVEAQVAHSTMSVRDVVTLASIVEKETGAKHERPMIAGVFHNRLQKGMRLQSDPTTIYGIWERYKGNLRKSDLLELTPYNTYKVPALPAGPICNPGMDAIRAVMEPERHNFLFFVSQNDGTHIFTEKYGQHLEAVKKFQIDAPARKGKSWRQLKQ